MSVRLKICGLTRRADLEACIELGVDAVGLNFWPGSKRGLSLPAARELVQGLERGSTHVVGVFVEASPEQVLECVQACELDAVQLHGDQAWDDYALLGVPLVRVVRGTPALEELVPGEPAPSWVILDAAVEGFGGQGRRTDWTWAASAVRHLAPLATWLAGGIDPANIAEALSQVRPSGVDVASGAELAGALHGEKDLAKVETLLRACRAHS